MKKLKLYFLAGIVFPFCWGCEKHQTNINQPIKKDTVKVVQDTIVPVAQKSYKKIIALGSPIAEIVEALGQEKELVAVDNYVKAVPLTAKLPKVGYGKMLRSNTLLKYEPDIILSTTSASPARVIREVQENGVDYFTFEHIYTLEDTKKLIRDIADKLGKKAQAEEIVKNIDAELLAIKNRLKELKNPASVLYIYANSETNIMLAGSNTPADVMIHLAGAKNAAKKIDGLKRLTAEEVISANPTYFLITSESYQKLDGKQGLSKIPGYYDTYAGQAGMLIIMDEVELFDFGSEISHNAQLLAKRIYPYQFVN